LHKKLCCNDKCRELDLLLMLLDISSPEEMPQQAKFTAKIVAAAIGWDMHISPAHNRHFLIWPNLCSQPHPTNRN